MLIIAILLLLTGCAPEGNSPKGDYILFFDEIWYVDIEGNTKLVYDEEQVSGMYANERYIYFFARLLSDDTDSRDYVLRGIDTKTNEVFTICDNHDEISDIWYSFGMVEHGDNLYCISSNRVGITGNHYIVQINKNDGSASELGTTHSPITSSMFVIIGGVISSCGWDIDSNTSYIYEYSISNHKLVSHDITGTLVSSRETESSYRWSPYFNGGYVYIIESKDDPKTPAKIHRAELGGEPEFSEFVELPSGFTSKGFISENCIAYFQDYEDGPWHILLDENMDIHKLYNAGTFALQHAAVLYYDNIFVSYVEGYDNVLHVGDYVGNAIEIPFEKSGH